RICYEHRFTKADRRGRVKQDSRYYMENHSSLQRRYAVWLKIQRMPFAPSRWITDAKRVPHTARSGQKSALHNFGNGNVVQDTSYSARPYARHNTIQRCNYRLRSLPHVFVLWL